jgi:cytochrome bd-type quinol oxidase subunit 2
MMNSTITTPMLQQAYTQQTVPALIIFFIPLIFIFLIVGLIVLRKAKSRGKFIIIWIISSIIGGIILGAMALLPNTIQTIIKSIIGG